MKLKKILALLLSFVLILGGIPAIASAEEVLPALEVVCEKSEVAIGDEVTFTVQLTNYTECWGGQFTLVIPEGLTLVADSFEELDTPRGWMAQLPEGTGLIYVAAATKAATGELVELMSFKCTVNENATAEMTVTLSDTKVAIKDANGKAVGTEHNVKGATVGIHVHDHNVWEYDENQHWQKCACGDETEKAAHEFEVATTEPTCDKDGAKVYTCKCGYSYTETLDAPGHTLDEGTVTKEATCTEPGEKTYKCTVEGCEYTKTEEIAALGHDMDEGTVTKEATCIENGVKTYKCKREGCTHTVEEVIKARGYHEHEGVITTEPTCEEPGVMTYTCECGDTYTEEIEALGHDYELKSQSGSLLLYECIHCGHTYEETGEEVTVNVDENGNVTIVTEYEDGTVVTKTKAGDAWVTTTEDAEGNKTIEVNVIGRAAKEAVLKGEPVEIVLPEGTDITTDIVVINTGKDEAIPVEIVFAEAEAGHVIVIVGEDGKETVVALSQVTEDGLVFLAEDGVAVKIADKALNFSDIKGNNWFNNAVDFVSARGIMTGMTAKEFAASGKTTRAQVWTMLARLSGVDTTCTTGNWYDVARAWAMETGISDGTGANDAITREQLVTMLYRYAQMKGTAKSINGFSDAASVSDWAKTAMEWAYGEGVMNGNKDGTLNAKGDTSRAEMAQFFMNFIQTR